MARISVMTLDKARPVPAAEGCADTGRVLAYYDGVRDPLHLFLHEVGRGGSLRIGPSGIDRLAYVWQGAVDSGGCRLEAGSSLVVEHGRELELTGAAEASRVLTFAAAQPPAQSRGGGHVHLLPAERVSRNGDLGATGVGGGMHFASDCPTCEIWLHENHFPGSGPMAPEEQARGVHSHSEDEIIFVTAGRIRLGTKLYGPGTSLAIAADTLYSFSPGPEGLSFVNFRAGTPGDIRFASGTTISETGYWKERVARPDYVELG